MLLGLIEEHTCCVSCSRVVTVILNRHECNATLLRMCTVGDKIDDVRAFVKVESQTF